MENPSLSKIKRYRNNLDLVGKELTEAVQEVSERPQGVPSAYRTTIASLTRSMSDQPIYMRFSEATTIQSVSLRFITLTGVNDNTCSVQLANETGDSEDGAGSVPTDHTEILTLTPTSNNVVEAGEDYIAKFTTGSSGASTFLVEIAINHGPILAE